MKHIAILKQPFFNMILNGEKTIESRWSFNKTAPYNKVEIGDIILLKETGKNVTATAIVKNVKYYQLTPEKVEKIKAKYGKQIGINNVEAWQLILCKKYCTLIWLYKVKKINPINVKRSYGTGWIVIDD
ncbi:MAG: ASCH domain-containing protein [Clostridia bacterium]|nr:ASCH domain-containing protein [Clostridia bacterium]MDD4686244.1 ASCH domain-containing protein [Clostridia bacterium]